MKKYIVLTLLTLSLNSLFSHAQNVGSSFSYQGELLDNGSPANANYDFGVDLYNNEIGGSPVLTDTHDDVSVVNGLFNLEIDFGDVAYETNSQYYIELRVTPSAGGATVALSPRTKLLSVPYATQAQFSTGGGGSWDINGSSLYTLEQVGIGEDNPSDRLHIRSDAGESALRVQVDGSTKLRVRENGGTTLGSNHVNVPENGLYVAGDVKQNSDSNGMLKYMFQATCDTSPTIDREYNATNETGTAGITRNSSGNCTITLPFNITDNFISATAIQAINGQNRVVGCVPFLSGMICQVSDGATATGVDGTFHVLVY